MRILYFGEYNAGGGAKSNLNLAIAASQYSEVGFFGIDPLKNDQFPIKYFETSAKKGLTLNFINDIKKALLKFNPDIVHATGMYTGLLSIILRFLTKNDYKIILTLRHTSKKFRFSFISKRVICLLNKADFVHYLTNYQREIYKQYRLLPKKYIIIPNIVFAHKYKKYDIDIIRKKLHHKTKSRYLIVFVGRVVENKQVHIFIECISNLRIRNYNVGGIIVGSGDEKYMCYLKELVNNLDLTNHIYFRGYVTNPESYIAGSDFCLFPAQEEALPRFIVESFSVGKTMVVSNHPSIFTVVRRNYDVLVANEHTPESYANECIKILSDNSLKLKLENGAKESYRKRYHPDFVMQQYKLLYEKILSPSLYH